MPTEAPGTTLTKLLIEPEPLKVNSGIGSLHRLTSVKEAALTIVSPTTKARGEGVDVIFTGVEMFRKCDVLEGPFAPLEPLISRICHDQTITQQRGDSPGELSIIP